MSRVGHITVSSSAGGSSAKGTNQVIVGRGGGVGLGVFAIGIASPSVFYAGSEHHGCSSSSGTASASDSRGRIRITHEVQQLV